MTVENRTQIYNYSPVTGEYTPSSKPLYARVDKLDPTNVPIPAYATDVAPPSYPANSIPVFDGSDWSVVADYRGVEYTDLEGNTVVITELGDVVPDTSSEEYILALKKAAFMSKATELATIKSMRNNVYPFMYEGNQYKNDEINIFGVKIAAYGKADTDPLQTFIGTENEGCWKTDDRQYIPYTYATFMSGVFETYFLMRSANFTNADALYHQLEAIYLDPTKTVADITAFDITTGWSESTVVPE